MKKHAIIFLLIIMAFSGVGFSTQVTKTYRFLTDQSTVSWGGGGWSGVHYETTITGTFNLTIDLDQVLAAPSQQRPNPYFDRTYISNVNAVMDDEVDYPFDSSWDYRSTQNLDELFRLSAMLCTGVDIPGLFPPDEATGFSFEYIPAPHEVFGRLARITVYDDYIDIRAGNTFYAYDGPGWGFNAIAVEVPEPATFVLFAVAGLVCLRRRRE